MKLGKQKQRVNLLGDLQPADYVQKMLERKRRELAIKQQNRAREIKHQEHVPRKQQQQQQPPLVMDVRIRHPGIKLLPSARFFTFVLAPLLSSSSSPSY